MHDFREEGLDDLVEAEVATVSRPLTISFIAVFAIVLGGFFLLGLVGSLPAIAMQIAGVEIPPREDAPPEVQLSAELSRAANRVQADYFLLVVLSTIISGVGAFYLIRHGVQVLRSEDRRWILALKRTCYWLSWYALFALIFGVITQYLSLNELKLAMLDIPNDGPTKVMKDLYVGFFYFMIGFIFLFQFAQIAYLVYSQKALGTFAKEHPEEDLPPQSPVPTA